MSGPELQKTVGRPSTARADDKEQVRSFTSWKLDLLANAAADSAIQPYDFRVLFTIARHVNAESGRTKLSDDTIADETVSTRRNVMRARKRLKRAGWLQWKRTRSANVYGLRADRVNDVMDTRLLNREARQERRAEGLNSRQAVTPTSHLKPSDVTSRSLLDVSSASLLDVTPTSPIHLGRYTGLSTPSEERGHSQKELLEGQQPLTDGKKSWTAPSGVLIEMRAPTAPTITSVDGSRGLRSS